MTPPASASQDVVRIGMGDVAKKRQAVAACAAQSGLESQSTGKQADHIIPVKKLEAITRAKLKGISP